MYVFSPHLHTGMNMMPPPLPALFTCHICGVNRATQDEYDMHMHSDNHRIKCLWYNGNEMAVCNGCKLILTGSTADHEATARHTTMVTRSQQLAPWITIAKFLGELPPRMRNQMFMADCMNTYQGLRHLHQNLFRAYFLKYPPAAHHLPEYDSPDEEEYDEYASTPSADEELD